MNNKGKDGKGEKQKAEHISQQKKQKVRRSLQIVRIAAFCFAIISWVATANGLSEYVFHHEGWQAYTLSFAIQAILFAFNLKLPAHFGEIGRKMRKEGKNWFQRWVFVYIPIAALYAMVLLCSSFFSYVYMSNLVYEDTRYNDANVMLNREYREKLNDTQNYAEQYTNYDRIIISQKLLNLDQMLTRLSGTQPVSVESKEELERAVSQARTELQIAESNYEAAVRSRERAQNAFDTAQTIALEASREAAEATARYRESGLRTARERSIALEERAKETQAELTERRKDLEQRTSEEREMNLLLIQARDRFTTSEQAEEKEKQSFSTNTHAMLIEILRPSPDITKLSHSLDAIHISVLELLQSDSTMSNFAELVRRTQELTTAVDRYVVVRSVLADSERKADDGTEGISGDISSDMYETNIEDIFENMPENSEENVSENSDLITIEKLQEQLLHETVLVPDTSIDAEAFSKQKTEWEMLWRNRFMTLQRIVQRLPRYSDLSLANLASDGNAVAISSDTDSTLALSDIIDFSILEQYDSNALATEIDDLTRLHLSEINVMERAWGYLWHNSYPFLARISLLIALFLDISSLLAGLFIYFAPAKKKKRSDEQDDVEQDTSNAPRQGAPSGSEPEVPESDSYGDNAGKVENNGSFSGNGRGNRRDNERVPVGMR